METSSILSKILQLLASRYGTSCSLEELAELVHNSAGSLKQSENLAEPEKEIQAQVLESLLQLNDQGLIFLDSDTDWSVITIKGLLKAHNRILCN
ncbi:hypothetical protein [Flavobacterium chungbukense]|uniref:Uncharacterized protein n=1 Tax=Flavobacterium chungbukense TaxID=877464 RepID=A0ABP7YF72_9FLAO|nr:hypothetical protein [Flavobacterium chungbukense]MCC4920584.1 hypothetical protein [Flavobacterium chungbukense]